MRDEVPIVALSVLVRTENRSDRNKCAGAVEGDLQC